MNKLLFSLITVFSCSILTCADVQWVFPPTTLSNTNLNSSDPQIGIDTSGDVVAAWLENGLVKARSKPASMSWGTAVTLSNANASAPRLVSDLSGNATAIWLEAGVVKAATKTLSGNWSSVTSLSNSGASSPALGINPDGDVVAVWARSGSVQARIKLSGASWQATQTISATAAASPSVGLGGTGANKRAVIVWHNPLGSINAVYSSTRLVASGTWSSGLVISDQSHNAAYATVALDVNANATAVWYSYDVNNSIYSSVVVQSSERSALLGTWDLPASLSAPGIRNPATLVSKVAYDAFGNAVALWNTSYDDMNYSLESSVKPLGGNWIASTKLFDPNLYAYSADIAVSAFGDALTLYMLDNGISLLIQSSEATVSGFTNNVWHAPLNLSQNALNGYPKVAATSTGNAIHAAAIWISNSNSINNIIQASTGTKNLLLPPSNLMVAENFNNFSLFNEYFNTLTWSASTDPSVVGYLVYRNGTLLAQVDANTLQFVDDNRVHNASVTYGVAAFNKQNEQSQIITVSFP